MTKVCKQTKCRRQKETAPNLRFHCILMLSAQTFLSYSGCFICRCQYHNNIVIVNLCGHNNCVVKIVTALTVRYGTV